MALHLAWLLHAFSSLLLVVSSFLIPSFYSYKALEAQQHLETWLTYWLVLGTFTTAEHLTWFFVSRIPFWSVIKLAFIVWLLLPQTQGAALVYIKFILPVLKHHEVVIDQYVELGESKVRKSLAHLGITQPHVPSQASFPSPGRLESLTHTVNRFGAGGSSPGTSQDVESRGNATKAS